MTTGHWNPGYQNIVSNLTRTNVAYQQGLPGSETLRDVHNKSLNRLNLDEIRRNARDVWSRKTGCETSYQDHYPEKHTVVDEFTSSRPTSGGRKNKPHPSNVFLTNRLHYIPGYHNADTTLGKDAYRIDASLSPGEKAHRDQLRTKYIGRPATAAVDQYRTNEDLDFIENPLERRVLESLMKLTNDENVLKDLREIKDTDRYNARGALERSYRPRTVPSLHRYLREAGAHESAKLHRVYENYMYGQNRYGAKVEYLDDRRVRDMKKMIDVTITNAKPTRRGDYLMHPEWPPSKPGHRLNGLSSVDVPYSKSTR